MGNFCVSVVDSERKMRGECVCDMWGHLIRITYLPFTKSIVFTMLIIIYSTFQYLRVLFFYYFPVLLILSTVGFTDWTVHKIPNHSKTCNHSYIRQKARSGATK